MPTLENQEIERHKPRDKNDAFHYEPVDQAENIANKKHIMAIMDHLTSSPLSLFKEAVVNGYHNDATINVTHPINELKGIDELTDNLWLPLRNAIPDMERRDDIVAAGSYEGAALIGCLVTISVRLRMSCWESHPLTK
jgi:hypothetical protein